MLSSSLPPIIQTLPAPAQASALQSGQTYGATVRVQQGALVAQFAGLQLPLPEGAPFTAGQRVAIQILSTGSTLQFAISAAAPVQAPSTSGGSPPGLEALLRPLLQALGKIELAPRASALAPPQLPPSQVSLQPLLTVLLSEQRAGQDLLQLQQTLTTALAQQAVPVDAAAAVTQWLGLAPGAVAESWRNLLARARAERAAIAKIAQSLGKSGARADLGAVKDSAGNLAQRLLSSATFETWLRERGELDSFRSLAQRLNERAQGSEAQNLRSLDQPYQFLELPVSERDGFWRAHIHSFSDRRNGGHNQAGAVHQTILDLETTHLGTLWIVLRTADGHCACRIRAVDPEVIALFESEATTLQTALEEAGYRSVTLTTEAWDGSRDEALIQLFAPYQKLDLEG